MGYLKKSLKNLICSTVAQLVIVVLGILVPQIILVGFGSDINGLLNSVAQIITCMTVFEAGIQSVAIKSLYATLSVDDRDSTNSILSAVNKNYYRTGIVYGAGLLILSIVYPLVISVTELTAIEIFLIVLFSGFGNVIAFFSQAKYRILLIADGREYIITNLNICISIISNVLKIVLFACKIDVYLIMIICFVISLMQMIYINHYVRREYRWVELSVRPDYNALGQSKEAMIHQVSGLVFSNTDVLLLTIACNLQIVSVYSVYKLITSHISSFVANVYYSCSFALGQLYNADRKRFLVTYDSLNLLFCILAFSIMSVTYILLPQFIALYTKGIDDAVYVDGYLSAMFVIAELLNLIRVPTRHLVNCAGHFRETLTRTITETVINLFVSIVGVLLYGIHGVVLGTIVALLYRSVDFAIYANKVILNRSSKKILIVYIANLLIAIGVISVNNHFAFEINSYLDFIKVGMCVTPIIIICFVLFNCCLFHKESKMALVLIRTKLKNNCELA